MKIPISKRLLACCNFVSKGDRVADVGTDHGYLGIWLLQNEIARSVIASDIVPGPLSSARRNAEKFGFADQMEFHLSDGAQSIPRDFDTLVCAGMGADTIISILAAAPWLRDHKYKLILQCQSKTALLRRYLSENGFQIRKETVLKDGRFLYTVMEVCFLANKKLTPGQWYFSPALLESNAPELPEYFRRVLQSLRIEIAGKKEEIPGEILAALQELEQLADMPENHYLLEDRK